MNVVVLLPFSDHQRTVLEQGAPSAAFHYAAQDELNAQTLASADAVIGNLDPGQLAQAPNLKLLQLNSAGFDTYSHPMLPENARMANATGAYGAAVSEHCFAALLALMKRLPAYRDAQREHAWVDLGPVTTLAGARVLVLGCGDIGTHFAELCRALGATVTGLRRTATGAARGPFAAELPLSDLATELPRADVVASFLPSSLATRGLVNTEFFEQMSPGAFFVNGGRGDLVDQAALAEALTQGNIAGAALDVTTPEPLPAADPLWDAPNLLITPHISGGFHHPAVLEEIARIASANLAHLAAGEPIENDVTDQLAQA